MRNLLKCKVVSNLVWEIFLWLLLLSCAEGFAIGQKLLLATHSIPLIVPEPIPFVVEHALTHEQRSWGLMQQRALPPNYALLFAYSAPQKIFLWSFNCYVDLAIAFLDQHGIIREFAALKAYPEKMDPNRPVHHLADMALYPPKDPIYQFFLNQSVNCTIPCCYACEAAIDFYVSRGVKAGDALVWNGSEGRILPTQNLSPYLQEDDKVIEFTIPSAKPLALWAAEHTERWIVEFYDNNGLCLQRSLLYGSKGRTAQHGHVIYCEKPVSLLRVKNY